MRLLIVVLLACSVTACIQHAPNSKAVVMLMDTSGTYTKELTKAHAIINYLLVEMQAGDAFSVGRIDSESFNEKDIIVRTTFSDKPSQANAQKRQFKTRIDEFMKTAKGSKHTDISGAVLQACEYLKETNSRQRFILIFSDLEEDLVKGHIRDFSLPLDNIQVIAINVTKLRADNVDPRNYLKRLEAWETKVTEGGGKWRVVNDLENLNGLLRG